MSSATPPPGPVGRTPPIVEHHKTTALPPFTGIVLHSLLWMTRDEPTIRLVAYDEDLAVRLRELLGR